MPWQPSPQPTLARLWTDAAELLRRRQCIEQALRSGPTDPRLLDPAEEGRALLAEREQVRREIVRVQEEIRVLVAGDDGRRA